MKQKKLRKQAHAMIRSREEHRAHRPKSVREMRHDEDYDLYNFTVGINESFKNPLHGMLYGMAHHGPSPTAIYYNTCTTASW